MDKLQQLMDRMDQNLANYHTHIKGFDKPEIIEMAGQIAAVADAHYYLQDHHVFDAAQVDYLLNFENPLEVVADAWKIRTDDISDMSFVLEEVFSGQDALRSYPLVAQKGTKPDVEKPERLSIRKQLEDAAKGRIEKSASISPGKDHSER